MAPPTSSQLVKWTDLYERIANIQYNLGGRLLEVPSNVWTVDGSKTIKVCQLLHLKYDKFRLQASGKKISHGQIALINLNGLMTSHWTLRMTK